MLAANIYADQVWKIEIRELLLCKSHIIYRDHYFHSFIYNKRDLNHNTSKTLIQTMHYIYERKLWARWNSIWFSDWLYSLSLRRLKPDIITSSVTNWLLLTASNRVVIKLNVRNATLICPENRNYISTWDFNLNYKKCHLKLTKT